MSKYIDKTTMKQYIRNFRKGSISDNRRFDPVDDCTLLCDVVNFAPAADVVEVVRCKDCNHYIAGFCARDINGRTNMFRMSENDYCSYGERKTDNG